MLNPRIWIIALAGMTVGALPVAADTVSTSSRMALFQSQLNVLDGRASEQYSSSTRLNPERDTASGASAPQYIGNYNGPYLATAKQMARRYAIPEGLFLRLVQQESGWNPSARSHKGAIGLAQLMPGTAALLGVNPNNPTENLEGGARYLRQQFDRFGRWDLALAAYNAGPEAVSRYNGIPPYRETQNYVRVIWGS
ncbi:lytic transglycosylase [Marivivens niveibacter]|uniref:Lytic transglycosylase n=1 Tax=Marivivens niveibacter TaxID=1930667 RepID=A0A251WVP2_9RHOB|nr:lytic transglycosylase domain-containing protein [Marivivens niveibacter]OUD08188.1 lytic transglycosylase [Marivivens niveibacter]